MAAAERARIAIPAWPFCNVTVRGRRERDSRYPADLRTLGDHLRARRLNLGLLQKEVARQLGASVASINNWELNQRAPAVWFLPAIITFLGYNPTMPGPDATFGDRLAAARRFRGLSQRAVGRFLGIDKGTVRAWEAGKQQIRPSRRVTRKIAEFLAGD